MIGVEYCAINYFSISTLVIYIVSFIFMMTVIYKASGFYCPTGANPERATFS